MVKCCVTLALFDHALKHLYYIHVYLQVKMLVISLNITQLGGNTILCPRFVGIVLITFPV